MLMVIFNENCNDLIRDNQAVSHAKRLLDSMGIVTTSQMILVDAIRAEAKAQGLSNLVSIKFQNGEDCTDIKTVVDSTGRLAFASVLPDSMDVHAGILANLV